MCKLHLRILMGANLVIALAMSAWVNASDLESARTLIGEGKHDDGIALLAREIQENPGNEAARLLLGEAYEKAGKSDEAFKAWEQLLKVSVSGDNLNAARKALSRLRRAALDQRGASAQKIPHENLFLIDMPEIDWAGLEKVEDSSFAPPVLPPPDNQEVPPITFKTPHFTVYSHNERLSQVIGERAETYLKWISKQLFGGRAWAPNIPIFVYSTYADYVSHGAPEGTGGVTAPGAAFGHRTGKTTWIRIYQLDNDTEGEPKIWKYGIESVLPHELTHAVLNEFFGSRKTPQWLHEAVAGRFEQTRNHYVEAARLARFVVAGEYFRMRDLFEQVGYPADSRIELFYEQSAVVVLYLFEAGPTAMYALLTELAAGNGHDAACAAALGIPKEGAVEEFERRWVQWMKDRYREDLNRAVDKTPTSQAQSSKHQITYPTVNELDTVANIANWRDVDLDKLDRFKLVGKSADDWSTDGGKLKSTISGRDASTILGIRMDETPPSALTFELRNVGSGGSQARFGVTQLDHDLHDTDIEVTASITDSSPHAIVCLWTDELSIYVDGMCKARYPASHLSDDAPDIDFPLALVAYGSFEVQNLRIGKIQKFSDKPVVVAEAEKKEEGGEQPPSTERRRGARRERNRSGGSSGPGS